MHANQLPFDWSGPTLSAYFPTSIEQSGAHGPCQTTPTEPVRARRTDPQTSHDAAERAATFAASHAGVIHLALVRLGNATGKELAAATGFSMEQVCRRLPELQALGIVRVKMEGGKPLVRCGARVWEAC